MFTPVGTLSLAWLFPDVALHETDRCCDPALSGLPPSPVMFSSGSGSPAGEPFTFPLPALPLHSLVFTCAGLVLRPSLVQPTSPRHLPVDAVAWPSPSPVPAPIGGGYSLAQPSWHPAPICTGMYCDQSWPKPYCVLELGFASRSCELVQPVLPPTCSHCMPVVTFPWPGLRWSLTCILHSPAGTVS